MSIKLKSPGKVVQEAGMGGHIVSIAPNLGLSAAGQVGDDHPPAIRERRAPGVEVFQRAHEAVTEEERVPSTLVEVPDPPLPYSNRMYVTRIDLLRKLDSDAYSPRVVSICALCRRPLKST